MDDSILVAGAQALLKLLDETQIRPVAALWVHNTDTGSWRLWVSPEKNFRDERAFYRIVSEAIAKNRDELMGVDAADVEMVRGDHPAVRALAQLFRVDAGGVIQLSSSRFNNFYLPDSIIVRMSAA